VTTSRRPVTRYINRIMLGLQRVAASDEPRLTFDRLVEVMGANAHRLLILMLTVLNMVPGPPGFGGLIAWTTLATALFMVLGKPIRLPRIIGERKLPLNGLLKASTVVGQVTGSIARFSKPRLLCLTGRAATLPYGILTMVTSLVMTIPIPFSNAIPNVGLCILAFSMLNRDGLGVILGVAVCLVGMTVSILVAFSVFRLGMDVVGHLW